MIFEEFLQVVKEIEDTQSLCFSWNRGIIILIYKDGDRHDFKNWHPITLLNINYNILVKIYAERLKTVLPSIIGDDQHDFLKGRW